MKKLTGFSISELSKTKKFLLIMLTLITGFTLFSGCTENDIELSQEETLSNTTIHESISTGDCGCSQYLSNGDGIPTFTSVEDFRDAYICLTECHNNWLDEIEVNYPNITSDEFDELIEDGTINEWNILDNFAIQGNYASLFRKDYKIESDWLESGGAVDEAPNEIIPDEILKAMINENCQVKIGRDIIDICNNISVATNRDLEWCTPYGWSSKFFPSVDGKHRIKLTGGIMYVPTLGLGSYIYGTVKAYKLRSGKWRRNREELDVRATCTVRKSPLNDCEILTVAPTGWKSKKARSLTVTK